ncbi:hypothetical protein MMC25_004849 [Agyrium rufum]|nr:hypothetical protein [Agyrium rufum]
MAQHLRGAERPKQSGSRKPDPSYIPPHLRGVNDPTLDLPPSFADRLAMVKDVSEKTGLGSGLAYPNGSTEDKKGNAYNLKPSRGTKTILSNEELDRLKINLESVGLEDVFNNTLPGPSTTSSTRKALTAKASNKPVLQSPFKEKSKASIKNKTDIDNRNTNPMALEPVLSAANKEHLRIKAHSGIANDSKLKPPEDSPPVQKYDSSSFKNAILASTKAAKRFPCPFKDCAVAYNGEGALIHHKHEMHEYCRVCEDFFDDWDAFHDHKLHSEKHICCDICSIDFMTSGGLELHYRQMHPGKNIVFCTACNMTFDCGAGLVEHFETDDCTIIKADDFARLRRDNQVAFQIVQDARNLRPTGRGYGDGFSERDSESSDEDDGNGLDLLDDDNPMDMDDAAIFARAFPVMQPRKSEMSPDEEEKKAAAKLDRLKGKHDAALTDYRSREPQVVGHQTIDKDFPVLPGGGVGINKQNLPIPDSDERNWPLPAETAMKVGGGITMPMAALLAPKAAAAVTTLPKAIAYVVLNPAEKSTPYSERHLVKNSKGEVILDPKNSGESFDFCRDGRGYHCFWPSCRDIFKNEQALRAHLISPAHWDLENECPGCHKVFRSAHALMAHIESASLKCCVKSLGDIGYIVGTITGGMIQVTSLRPDGSLVLEGKILDDPQGLVTRLRKDEKEMEEKIRVWRAEVEKEEERRYAEKMERQGRRRLEGEHW